MTLVMLLDYGSTSFVFGIFCVVYGFKENMVQPLDCQSMPGCFVGCINAEQDHIQYTMDRL